MSEFKISLRKAADWATFIKACDEACGKYISRFADLDNERIGLVFSWNVKFLEFTGNHENRRAVWERIGSWVKAKRGSSVLSGVASVFRDDVVFDHECRFGHTVLKDTADAASQGLTALLASLNGIALYFTLDSSAGANGVHSQHAPSINLLPFGTPLPLWSSKAAYFEYPKGTYEEDAGYITSMAKLLAKYICRAPLSLARAGEDASSTAALVYPRYTGYKRVTQSAVAGYRPAIAFSRYRAFLTGSLSEPTVNLVQERLLAEALACEAKNLVNLDPKEYLYLLTGTDAKGTYHCLEPFDTESSFSKESLDYRWTPVTVTKPLDPRMIPSSDLDGIETATALHLADALMTGQWSHNEVAISTMGSLGDWFGPKDAPVSAVLSKAVFDVAPSRGSSVNTSLATNVYSMTKAAYDAKLASPLISAMAKGKLTIALWGTEIKYKVALSEVEFEDSPVFTMGGLLPESFTITGLADFSRYLPATIVVSLTVEKEV